MTERLKAKITFTLMILCGLALVGFGIALAHFIRGNETLGVLLIIAGGIFIYLAMRSIIEALKGDDSSEANSRTRIV